MSKFYYSGSLEQVNFLSRRDIFFQFLFGKWQTMLLEGILLILFGISTILYEAFDVKAYFDLPTYMISYAFAGLILIMCLAFLITYLVVKKSKSVNILKQRIILDIFASIFLFIFPNALYGFLGSACIFFGLSLIVNRRNQKALIKVIGALILIAGIGLLFTNSYSALYINYLLAALFIVIGSVITYYANIFRKSMTRFEDEQKGFTDYTIE